MIFLRHRKFLRKVVRLPENIKRALAERLRLFADNPFNVLLNNHPLHGKFRAYRSINITGDYRLVFEEYDVNTIRLIDIDTHSKLYGK